MGLALKTLFLSLLSLSLLVLANGCDKANLSTPTQLTLESEHFKLISNSQLSTESENTAVIEKAELMYDRIIEILGDSLRPERKITLRLEGDFVEKGPYFDNRGIHLYRYSTAEDGYLGAIAHELVHALHEDYYIQHDPYKWPYYPYIDEGVAEYISQLVDPENTWFPWYGFNEYVVVGDLIISGQDISQQTLRTKHFELNQPCHIQSYTLRSSWMRYIDTTYGRETLIKLSYTEINPTEAFIETLFGTELANLDSAWENWAIEQYNTISQAESIAQAFREQISWYEYCD